MAEAFIHPTEATTFTHDIQLEVSRMPISKVPLANIAEFASNSGCSYSAAKDILETMHCVKIIRTGGPIKFRKNKDQKTVLKTFDAYSLPESLGLIPDSRCTTCPYSNATMRSEFRNTPTVGCIILGMRSKIITR